jgi:hypothetical protein
MAGVRGGASVASRYHYMINLLDTLRAFGGESTSQEVYQWFKDRGIARPEDLANIQRSKETRFVKEVRFARQLLYYGGLIHEDVGGSWRLTPDGWNADLDLEGGRSLARRSNWKIRPTGKATQQARRSLPQPTSGPTKGPFPHAWSRMIDRDVSGPASTYVMRFGESSIWKIGFAANVTKRLADLNRHVPTELLRCRWMLAHECRWPDAASAYLMEQRVLAELADRSSIGERLDCPEELLLAVWDSSRAPKD